VIVVYSFAAACVSGGPSRQDARSTRCPSGRIQSS
jgi:hypothetical protein